MAIPATKAELLSYCKRQLGAPVVEINVDDDQADEYDFLKAVQFFWRKGTSTRIVTYLH